MKRIGYVRVNSKTQNIDDQIKQLKNVSKIFVDNMSAQSTESLQHVKYPQLTAMLDFICAGNIVVVTELNQLSNRKKELIRILNAIQKKGATLEVLNLPTFRGIENDNFRGLITNFVIELYKYQVYQDEHVKKLIKERQAQGIGIAKKLGKFKGGKPKYEFDNPTLQQAFRLYLEGETENSIEKVTGINRRTFRRYREKYDVYRKSNEKVKKSETGV